MIPRAILSALLLAAGAVTGHARPPAKHVPPRPAVRLLRVPNGGIQPQAAVDGKGTIHLIYFKGEPGAGVVLDKGIHGSDGCRRGRGCGAREARARSHRRASRLGRWSRGSF